MVGGGKRDPWPFEPIQQQAQLLCEQSDCLGQIDDLRRDIFNQKKKIETLNELNENLTASKMILKGENLSVKNSVVLIGGERNEFSQENGGLRRDLQIASKGQQ